jgi:hypothetical protein
MLNGENHRERVLSPDEETRHLAAGAELLAARGDDVLLDCALRPEEPSDADDCLG